MAQVIAVSSGKGGTGKSTLCVGLSRALAEMNNRVLVIELDIGLRGLDILMGCGDRVVYDLGDLLSGGCTMRDAIVVMEDDPRLGLIAAPSNLQHTYSVDQIVGLCDTLRADFDYILLDLPAGLGLSVLVSSRASDLVLVVTTPDPICIRDGGKIVSMLTQMGKDKLRLVINKASRRSVKTGMVRDLDDVIDGVGIPLLGVLPESETLPAVLAKGERLDHSDLCNKVFSNIAHRIRGEYVPLAVK